MAKDGGDGAARELSEQFSKAKLDQLPHFALAHTQFPHLNARFGEGSSSESQLNLHRKLIEHQIEVPSI